MMAVPRELFVPPALVGQAYSDNDIPVGDGRVLLKPMVLAKLIQAALIGRAIMFSMSAAPPAIRRRCWRGWRARWWRSSRTRRWRSGRRRRLAPPGAGQVTVATGPLAAGWPAAAPYDFILLNGGSRRSYPRHSVIN